MTTGSRPRPVVQVGEVTLPGDLSERRRQALAEAVAEARSSRSWSDPDSWEPAIAVRSYGVGALALALGGAFDRSGVERLRGLLRDVHRLATHELVVDLSALSSCDPTLTRVLSQLRIQRLAAGARVELHNPPAALAAELGHAPAESYLVVDDAPASPDTWGR